MRLGAAFWLLLALGAGGIGYAARTFDTWPAVWDRSDGTQPPYSQSGWSCVRISATVARNISSERYRCVTFDQATRWRVKIIGFAGFIALLAAALMFIFWCLTPPA